MVTKSQGPQSSEEAHLLQLLQPEANVCKLLLGGPNTLKLSATAGVGGVVGGVQSGGGPGKKRMCEEVGHPKCKAQRVYVGMAYTWASSVYLVLPLEPMYVLIFIFCN